MPRPHFMPASDWDELVNEAVCISRHWGAKALSFGWRPLDLFGSRRDPQKRNVDCNGLVATLVNMDGLLRLEDITTECAILKDRHGNILRFRPGARPGQIFLWEAYAMRAGP